MDSKNKDAEKFGKFVINEMSELDNLEFNEVEK